MNRINNDVKEAISGGSITVSAVIAVIGAVFAVTTLVMSIVNGVSKVSEAEKQIVQPNMNRSIRSYQIRMR